tara:strand:- start:3189 stop:3473 length:285 start_codon:yes stop_codon:yes gene_type:complete
LNDKKLRDCFIANACSEMVGGHENIDMLLTTHHEKITPAIAVQLQKNNFKTARDAKKLANVFMTYLTGMNQEVKFNQNKNQLQSSINTILRLID